MCYSSLFDGLWSILSCLATSTSSCFHNNSVLMQSSIWEIVLYRRCTPGIVVLQYFNFGNHWKKTSSFSSKYENSTAMFCYTSFIYPPFIFFIFIFSSFMTIVVYQAIKWSDEIRRLAPEQRARPVVTVMDKVREHVNLSEGHGLDFTAASMFTLGEIFQYIAWYGEGRDFLWLIFSIPYFDLFL